MTPIKTPMRCNINNFKFHAKAINKRKNVLLKGFFEILGS